MRKMAIDPICKMAVDEKMAKLVSEYKGKKYYFCAPGCKKAFDQNPEKHLGGEMVKGGGGGIR
jgi:YHS domain-containing protein